MSGNPDDSKNGDDGQPQGGQPPQNGQPPQGGQPQGGQPQGGQPTHGGQPPQGQPQGQAHGQSFAEQNEVLIDWTKFVSILFAIAGAGIGLFYVLFDAVDVQIISIGGRSFSPTLLFVPLFFMILIAPLIGAGLASRIQEPQEEIVKISAASLAAGTAIVSILSMFFISTTFNGSLEFGGLLVNTILGALFAGGVSAGGAWTMLNQYPQ